MQGLDISCTHWIPEENDKSIFNTFSFSHMFIGTSKNRLGTMKPDTGFISYGKRLRKKR
jgi:hypothetical protein